MATLQYIAASRVDGADKYKLYKKSGGTNTHIATSDVIQPFPYRGVMWNGKEVEREQTVFIDGGETNSKIGRPLRMITEKGARYYIRVTGTASVRWANGFTETRDFDGVYYLDNNEDFRFWIIPNPHIEKADDGYNLMVNLNGNVTRIHIFDLDPEIDSAMFGKGQTTVTLHSNDYSESCYHTEYLPIFALSDDWVPNDTVGAVCVGPFSITGTFEYHKISFYNKNLKFLAGASTAYINEEYGEDKQYFTLNEILAIAEDLTGNQIGGGGENDPEFVVFCSNRRNASDQDYVCVGNNGYFPLFAIPDSYFDEGNNTLVVTADSRSTYYEESEPSDPVTYVFNKTTF